MNYLRFGLVPLVILLAGCGTSVGSGSSTGGIKNIVAKDTSAFAVMEISTGKVSFFTDLPNDDPNLLKTTHMAFRRVNANGKDAFVGVMEVSQQQWQALYLLNSPAPAQWPWEKIPNGISNSTTSHGPMRPAYNLRYDDTDSVVDSFAPATGARLSITTEAQWIAACGGVTTGWWWGASATPAGLQSQLAANAVVRESIFSAARSPVGSFGIDTGGPLDIGSRDSSPLGFYDLHGNVWEMIAGGDHAKGGSWRDSAWQSRTEANLGGGQNFQDWLDYTLVGVRLVLAP